MMNPDPESISWLRFLLATTTVIGLMGLLAWGLKFTAARGWIAAKPLSSHRLKIIESLPLDARRRLVIIQCDRAQHLLLLGLNDDRVIASNLPPAPATDSTKSS
jgi:flagellar protein FliO/FliZ